MKYIKLFNSQESAIDQTLETPNVCGLDGSTKTLYIPGTIGTSVKIIKDSDFINYSTGPDANGYEYVDLGLPSGTLWATCNVGATSPEGYGKYFQWGDTVGYTDASHSTWATAPFNNGSSSYDSTYFTSIKDSIVTVDNDGNYNLNPEYDAAHVIMGGDWLMPTYTQSKELEANTTSEWTTLNGVNGYKFTSKVDTTKSIFVPAAGCADDGSLFYQGSSGDVWSSSLDASYPSGAWGLDFGSSGMSVDNYDSRFGYSLRGVLVP